MPQKTRPQWAEWNTSQRSVIPQWLAVEASKFGWKRWTAFSAAVVTIAGLTAWALWPEPPRQREYLDATACLLTDEAGIAAEPAKTVWSTLQQTSVTTLVRAQYLQVKGPKTTENAAAYLASLTSRRCGAIIAVGHLQIAATADAASSHPAVKFVTIEESTVAPNVLAIDPRSSNELQENLKRILEELAVGAPDARSE